MWESWLVLALLGLVASFMPSVLGVEAVLLGTEGGVRRVLGLLAGITLARIIIAFGVFSVFASVLEIMRMTAAWAAESAVNLLERINALIVAEGHWALDIMLTVAGVWLIIEAINYARGVNAVTVVEEQTSEDEVEDDSSPGMLGTLGVGLLLAITGPKQWVLTVAAMNIILAMPPKLTFQFSALAVYLLLGISIVAIPVLLYLFRPERAQALLTTMNGWITGVMRYVVAAILGAIGIYFIWNSGLELMRSLLA